MSGAATSRTVPGVEEELGGDQVCDAQADAAQGRERQAHAAGRERHGQPERHDREHPERRRGRCAAAGRAARSRSRWPGPRGPPSGRRPAHRRRDARRAASGAVAPITTTLPRTAEPVELAADHVRERERGNGAAPGRGSRSRRRPEPKSPRSTGRPARSATATASVFEPALLVPEAAQHAAIVLGQVRRRRRARRSRRGSRRRRARSCRPWPSVSLVASTAPPARSIAS